MRKLALISVALMVVLAGCGGFAGTDTPTPETTDTPKPGETPTDTPVETPAETPTPETPPPDQREGDEDTLGYVNGIWYDQSIDVDASDGLSADELEQLKYRAMARLEVIRDLPFEEDVPVEIQTREEYQQALEEDGLFDPSENERIHQNVKWEAPFLVDQQTDAHEELQSFYGGAVLGYYDSQADQIVVVSPGDEDGVPDGLDEMTLAHELVHALQDQHYDLTQYGGATTEDDNAVSGLIEGDARYTEHLYEQRCGGEWECLDRPDSSNGGDFNLGVWAIQFVPYSEGPTLIQELHQQGGWEAVNEVYENPPASTSQLIHHEKYPDQTPAHVTVEDRSNDEWAVPQMDGGVDHISFGEAGLYVMLWYPSYEATEQSGQQTNVIIDYIDFFNLASPAGDLEPIGPYDYSHEITDGWNGDRLLPYVSDAGETGYVWQIEWESDEDASQFVDAYVDLLEYHDAEEVDDGVYEITDGDEFEGAFSIQQDGTSVVIVNAPSVEDLDDVHDGAGQ